MQAFIPKAFDIILLERIVIFTSPLCKLIAKLSSIIHLGKIKGSKVLMCSAYIFPL